MNEIILASNNEHKIREIQQILTDFKVVSMREAGINIEIIEDGETFEENAYKKAKTICELTGKPVMADDSGLCVEELDGAPGVYSARYSMGEPCSSDRDDANNKLLLKNMKRIENRRAYFECDIVIVFPNGEKIVEVGKWLGNIAEEERGKNGFGYDVLFLPDEYPDKTSAELAPEVKNGISHRAKALKQLRITVIK